MPVIDLAFPTQGDRIPLDHGYALYGAISRVVPQIHEFPRIAIHPVRGQSAGDGNLILNDRSRITLRMPVERIPEFLSLAGQALDLDGHALRTGVPQVFALKPTPNIAAHMVTIKGFMEPAGFLDAARRQLDALDISDEAVAGIPKAEEGRPGQGQPIRRVMRIKDKTIVGFAVQVTGLTAEESLILQEHGIGGRRHMGCGVFVPFAGA